MSSGDQSIKFKSYELFGSTENGQRHQMIGHMGGYLKTHSFVSLLAILITMIIDCYYNDYDVEDIVE